MSDDIERERLRMMASEARIERWKLVEDRVMAALQKGEREITITLGTLAWLDVIEEVRNRPLKNMPTLLRDTGHAELREIIDRLHEEFVFLVSRGRTRTVSERIDRR